MRPWLSILTALGGFGFLVLGLCQRWFVLPKDFSPAGELVTVDAPETFWWKLAVIFVLATAGFWLAFHRKLSMVQPLLIGVFSALLPFLLLYPQAVIVQNAGVSGDAAWLQQQFDNITWLGGDVYRGHSERPVPGGMGLWAQEPPFRLAAFRPPMTNMLSLGVAEVPDLVWWLGYNPAFSQFMGRGWMLCVLGVMFTLAGVYSSGRRRVRVAREGGRKPLVRKAALYLSISTGIVFCIAMFPLVTGGKALREARSRTLAWDAQGGLDALDRAEKKLPALSFDTGVILQRGALLKRLGRGREPAALLHEAWILFDQGHPQRSSAILSGLLDGGKLSEAERREALRGLLRSAVDDLNSSRLTEARRIFSILVEENPVCLQAWFHYQLASLQAGDVVKNRLAAERVEIIAGSFLRKEKRGIIAASKGMLAQGELAVRSVEATVSARQEAQGR